MADAGAPDPDVMPVAADEAARLLSPLSVHDRLLLAISGGADSMALLHLVARWRREAEPTTGKPAIIVATVDHGLRAGSAAEAAWVAGRSARLGLPHFSLPWPGPHPANGLQAAARAARYRLLAAVARARPGSAIVTAHTLDDQAETLLMRLARGSGVDGLAAMRAVQPLGNMLGAKEAATGSGDGGVLVHRPLLTIAKARLIATLRGLGEPWLEDPSNENPAFERVRLRRAAAALAAAGLSSAALGLSARRLARVSIALERATGALWERLVADHDGAFASLPLATLLGEPEELRVRLLARLLAAYGGSGRCAPLAKAEHLDGWLARAATGPRAATTIAGCRARIRDRRLEIWREWGRGGLPSLLLAAGETGIWDGRFRVDIAATAPGPWRIAAVGDAGLAIARGAGPLRVPAAIARTLPSVWAGDRLVSVPHLGFVTGVPPARLTFLGPPR